MGDGFVLFILIMCFFLLMTKETEKKERLQVINQNKTTFNTCSHYLKMMMDSAPENYRTHTQLIITV